jgi:hypothetical protein
MRDVRADAPFFRQTQQRLLPRAAERGIAPRGFAGASLPDWSPRRSLSSTSRWFRARSKTQPPT